MKKIVLTIITVLSLSSLFLNPSLYLNASTIETDYIGYGVDIVASEYGSARSVKIGSPIIDPYYLSRYANYIEGTLLETNRYTTSATSVSELITDTTMNFAASKEDSGIYDIFTGTISNQFSLELSNESYTYTGQYYFMSELLALRKQKALEEYSSNIEKYQPYLTSSFLSALSDLQNGHIGYDSFFSTYGTHIVGKAYYGGKLSVSHSILTNETMITTTMKSDLENTFKLGILNFGLSSMSISADISNVSGLRELGLSVNSRVRSFGGNVFDIGDIAYFQSYYQNWLSSIDTNPALIGFGDDGLVPIWRLVPDSYTGLKTTMELMFYRYQEKYLKEVKTADPLSIHIPAKSIRLNEYTITDSGRFNQKYDTISVTDLITKVGISPYNNVKVYLTIEVNEIKDGYQHIYLYRDLSQSSNSLITEDMIEHVPGKIGINSTVYTLIFDVKLSDISNGYVIRYGASGFQEDTWKNKNLFIGYKVY